MSSRGREQESPHEQEQFEKWQRGEIVPEKDLQRIAQQMVSALDLKSVPDVKALEDMALYKRIMGPSSSVFHAPAFLSCETRLRRMSRKQSASRRRPG